MNISHRDIKWLKVCTYSAQVFATCSRRQYFAIIIDNAGHVVGTGYNGGPKGTLHCNQGGCPRALQGAEHGSNYDSCIAIHAEQNALLHSNYDSRIAGSTLYVNGPPCSTCAKLIANSGIIRVVHTPDDAYADWPNVKNNLESWGVEVVTVGFDMIS